MISSTSVSAPAEGGEEKCDGDCDNDENICESPADVLMLMLLYVLLGVLTSGGCCDNTDILFLSKTGATMLSISGWETTQVLRVFLTVMVSLGEGLVSSRLLPQLSSPLLFTLVLSWGDDRIGDSPRGAVIASISNRTDLPLSFKPPRSDP